MLYIVMTLFVLLFNRKSYCGFNNMMLFVCGKTKV